MGKKRDNSGELLEPRADEINRERQPDWEAVADVKARAKELAKGATREQLGELEQLADDAVPDDRPEIRAELARILAALPVKG